VAHRHRRANRSARRIDIFQAMNSEDGGLANSVAATVAPLPHRLNTFKLKQDTILIANLFIKIKCLSRNYDGRYSFRPE
jgi:hypothetical protein